MFKMYLKVAWRNLMKNKIFSFINVFGLSAGLTCCMLITLYLIQETSYDRHHRNSQDLYQLATIFQLQGNETAMPNTPAAMGETMMKEYPEIVATTRLMGLFQEDKTLLQYHASYGTASFYETKGFLADPSFFTMFTYHFVEGDPATALVQQRSIVISEDIAKKIFGGQPALNQIIRVSSNTNGDNDFRITGVFRPMDAPSHIDARFFLSMRGGKVEDVIREKGTNMAGDNMFYTYLQLKPGSSARQLEAKFPGFIEKYAGSDLKAMGFYKKQFLVRVPDIHLHSGMTANVTSPGSLTYLYILASAAIFTLLIACINFMNLSTARSARRSTEVGVRKVLGAEKGVLIRQFLGESVVMSFIAFCIALVASWLLLPLFSNMTGKHLSVSLVTHFPVIAGFLGLAIMTGFVAGSYPAFYLSSFEPVKVLKGRFSNSLAAIFLRKGLVIFQFIISVILIISSLIIHDQMRFMRTMNLGFDKEQQLVIPMRSYSARHTYISFKNDINANQMVQSVGASQYYPGIAHQSDILLYKQGQSNEQGKRVRMNAVDADFIHTLGLQIIRGRSFSRQFMSDTVSGVVLNEDAVKEIGFASAEKAIGQKVYSNYEGRSISYDIVGVVKDFHFEDLHLPITPYAFELKNPDQYNYMLVRKAPGSLTQLLSVLAATWRKFNPNEPFEYSFLDEDFQKNYQAEDRLSSIVVFFTIMAIIISCLGLFGLASFSAEQRIKEIGIRRVLGASVSGIVVLLSKDFMKLVVVAVLIASPIAWAIMHSWLQDFAYRTTISWTVFGFTLVISFFIALFALSFQAMRAALANPVKSIKSE